MNVFRISGNFLYEQRWVVAILVVYAAAMSSAVIWLGHHPSRQDVEFFVKQQSVLAAFFAASMATTIIHNDLKSRRIMSVLSKAVPRYEYLLSAAAASIVMALLYLGVAIGILLAVTRGLLPSDALAEQLLASVLLSILGVAAILCFATFVPPLFASALAAVALFAPAAVARGETAAAWCSPAFALGNVLLIGKPVATAVPPAMVHAILWFILAAILFQRRDIALPVD